MIFFGKDQFQWTSSACCQIHNKYWIFQTFSNGCRYKLYQGILSSQIILGFLLSCKSITNNGSVALKVTKYALSHINLDDLKSSHFAIHWSFHSKFNFLLKFYKSVALEG